MTFKRKIIIIVKTDMAVLKWLISALRDKLQFEI